jgi:hypothetical protein
MRYQAYSNLGVVDEPESSVYVEIERDPALNPAIYVDCSDLPSLTRQEFAAECDINNLVDSFQKTGIFPSSVNPGEPRYLDVSDVPDLQQAHAILQEATAGFMSLPAIVRRDFDNDPLKFIAFAENPENIEKMREWKLAPPAPVEPPPQKVEVSNLDALKPSQKAPQPQSDGF